MALQVDDSLAGQAVTCPGCDAKINVPQSVPRLAGSSPGTKKQQRGGWPEADPANVNIWQSLLLGLGMMALVVGLLFLIRDTFLGHLFFSGGWVNVTNFVLFFWGISIVILKYRKTKHQRDALLLDIIPESVGKTINPGNIGRFIDHLYKLPQNLRDSMMVNRIRKGLELFEARTSNSEVATLFEAQSNVDANRIAGSYALVKVFLWAIPILGFVGTVLGLSVAIAGFGMADMADVEALSASITEVTGGLATAFNTTLLGLILSLILIFPMSAMQKREEDCLNDIDAFCNETVLPKLNDGQGGDAESQQLLQNPAAFAQMLSDFSESQHTLVENLNHVTATVQASAESLELRAQEHQQRVEESLVHVLNQLMEQTVTSVNTNAEAVQQYVGTLSQGIDALNGTLEELGQRRVLITEWPRKRRWGRFFRSKAEIKSDPKPDDKPPQPKSATKPGSDSK